ncbi:MAG: hypothetical protein JJE51_14845 [Thermoanaerobaculia bacterium]|nr:hypothetical protein [Thermoanaerobaculia bacterium]
MAEADGRSGGADSGRFSRQQRAHLAALLTLVVLLGAAPARAQSDIDFDPAITQAEFRQFSMLVAQGIFASPVHPAGASGLLRFDIGIAATVVEIDTTAPYWQKAVGSDFSVSDKYVGVPRLVVTKGLGAANVSGSYAKLSDTGIEVWGGSLDIPIIRGGALTPTLALRGSYSTLRGVDVYQLNTYGAEIFLSKGFGPVTPYGAVGKMRSDAKGTIPATSVTPEILLTDKSDSNRYTLGVRISLIFPKLVVEATQAEERSYSAKVSVGF